MISPLHYLTPGSNSILKLFPSFSSFDLTTHSDKHLPISFEITVIYRHHWIFARDQFFAAPPNWVSLIGSVSQQRSGLTLCEVWFARVCSFHLMYSPDLTPSADSGCDSASLMADISLSFWPRSERRGVMNTLTEWFLDIGELRGQALFPNPGPDCAKLKLWYISRHYWQQLSAPMPGSS